MVHSTTAASTWFRRFNITALVLCFIVIGLGAWVRLTHAGLGCPDWPGCYGSLMVPESAEAIAQANAAYPERPVETGKAWREMIHRYAAEGLGLLVVSMAGLALMARRRGEAGQPWRLPVALVGLILFQGLLGMWTVTWQLKPVVVMAHLLGGMTTLSLLWWLLLSTRPAPAGPPVAASTRPLALAALVVVGMQIALGGWTSTNYAALSCPDFPTCQGQWLPDADFSEGFVMWRGLEVDYEGGVLDNASRVAIHLTHRIGAITTLLVVGAAGFVAFRRGRQAENRRISRAALAVLVLLGVQLTIGITIVLNGLPLALAVTHNTTAALLLLSVVTLNVFVFNAVRRPAAERAPRAAGQTAPVV
ncbi:MAG: COX15/CtaA family protein [Pseudomonadota bacterium]